MTTTPDLTDEELNIAICEWRGFVWSMPDEIYFLKSQSYGKKLPSHITGIEALGNMHEAEKGLSRFESELYACLLVGALNPGRIDEYDPGKDGAPTLAWHGVFAVMTATAGQRAIALLRVVKPELFP